MVILGESFRKAVQVDLPGRQGDSALRPSPSTPRRGTDELAGSRPVGVIAVWVPSEALPCLASWRKIQAPTPLKRKGLSEISKK
jgi:hypothetical protein